MNSKNRKEKLSPLSRSFIATKTNSRISPSSIRIKRGVTSKKQQFLSRQYNTNELSSVQTKIVHFLIAESYNKQITTNCINEMNENSFIDVFNFILSKAIPTFSSYPRTISELINVLELLPFPSPISLNSLSVEAKTSILDWIVDLAEIANKIKTCQITEKKKSVFDNYFDDYLHNSFIMKSSDAKKTFEEKIEKEINEQCITIEKSKKEIASLEKQIEQKSKMSAITETYMNRLIPIKEEIAKNSEKIKNCAEIKIELKKRNQFLSQLVVLKQNEIDALKQKIPLSEKISKLQQSKDLLLQKRIEIVELINKEKSSLIRLTKQAIEKYESLALKNNFYLSSLIMTGMFSDETVDANKQKEILQQFLEQLSSSFVIAIEEGKKLLRTLTAKEEKLNKQIESNKAALLAKRNDLFILKQRREMEIEDIASYQSTIEYIKRKTEELERNTMNKKNKCARVSSLIESYQTYRKDYEDSMKRHFTVIESIHDSFMKRVYIMQHRQKLIQTEIEKNIK